MELETKDYSNNKMLKSIITLLENPKPSRSQLSLAWGKAKQLDPKLKGKKDWDVFQSLVGRTKYITKAYKTIASRLDAVTDKSKKRVEQSEQFLEMEKMRMGLQSSLKSIETKKGKIDKIVKIRNRIMYTVRFRILTLTDENSLKKVKLVAPIEKKTRKNHIVNGKTYTQIGRLFQFETTDKWFMNNFKSNGTKNDIVIRATRGEKGSRWNRTVLPVMRVLEEMGANHIIAYMDAIYIPEVTSSADKAEPTNVKKQKKHNDSIKGLYHDYLYHELGDENKYAEHPYLKNHFKEKSCLLTAIIETYSEAFKKKNLNGRRKIKENLTYEYLCELFGLECEEGNIGCTLQEARPFFEKFRLGLKVFDIFNNVVEEYIPPSRNTYINPTTLYLVTFNGHVFTLDENLKALQQKVELIGASPIDVNKISPNFRIQDQTDDQEYHVWIDRDLCFNRPFGFPPMC